MVRTRVGMFLLEENKRRRGLISFGLFLDKDGVQVAVSVEYRMCAGKVQYPSYHLLHFSAVLR